METSCADGLSYKGGDMTKRQKSPTTSDPSTPLSVNQPVELGHLSEWSQALWQETSSTYVTQCFVDILVRYFGMQASAIDRIFSKENALTFHPGHTLAKPMDHQVRNYVRTTLQAMTQLREPEYRIGLNRLQITLADGEEKTCFFCLIGDPAVDWHVFYWSMPEPTLNGEKAIDFLCKQLQQIHSWCRRLDNTQSLLYRDDLTGLFNSRYLDVVITDEVRRAQRFHTEFCLLFIDLDDFKPVNDNYGHLAGSDVLQQVAEVLRATLREVDCIIRYGGDEFVVLLLGSGSKAGILAAERIRRAIENHRFTVSGAAYVQLTCSIGVASFPEHGHDRESLLKLADDSMYRSKKGGKNRVSIVNAGHRLNETLQP